MEILLMMGEYQGHFLSDLTLKVCSVTITVSTITVIFSKTAEVAESMGYIVIDTNERSLDCATSKKRKLFKYDLS